MAQDNTDEIDLKIVFDKIKKLGNNLLIRIYSGIQFVFKHWWKLLILLLIGGVIGYFIEEKYEPNKETTIIVQNNFNSSNYVYEAVEQLNQKLKEKDTVYLKNAGFRTDTIVLKEILIEPIVNIIQLLNKSGDSYQALETFLDKAIFEDELLTSELFLTEYTYHKINIKTTSEGTQENINNVMSFLNNNEMYNQIKTIIVNETKNRIDYNKETIHKIDAILESHSKVNQSETNPNQLVVSSGVDYTDFYELINSKNNAIAQITNLKTTLVKYDKIITIINKPSLIEINKLLSNHKFNFAFLFVFLYLFYFLMKNIYFSIKKLAENTSSIK